MREGIHLDQFETGIAATREGIGVLNYASPGKELERPTTEKMIAERHNQTFASRLAEYLTGLRPESPAMVERLATDREIIRAKYKLPPSNLPPAEFERALREIAKKNDTRIKPRSERGKFFEENPLVAAAYFEDNQIGADIDQKDLEAYVKSLKRLEHELVHAMQNQKSPSMPIELMEYEAYVAGLNIGYLKEHPEDIEEILFGFFIGGSVNTYYALESEKRGAEVSPEWDNEEYFLKRDGIDLEKN